MNMNKLNSKEKISNLSTISAFSNSFFTNMGLDENSEKNLIKIHKTVFELNSKKNQKNLRLSKIFEKNKNKILKNNNNNDDDNKNINNIEYIKEQENMIKEIVIENSQKSKIKRKKKIENINLNNDDQNKEFNSLINKQTEEINKLKIIIKENKEINQKYEKENIKMIKEMQKIIKEQNTKLDLIKKENDNNLKQIKEYKLMLEKMKKSKEQENNIKLKTKEYEKNLDKIYKEKVQTEMKKINILLNQNLKEKISNLKSKYDENYEKRMKEYSEKIELLIIHNSPTDINSIHNNESQVNLNEQSPSIKDDNKNCNKNTITNNEHIIKKEETVYLFECSNLPYLVKHILEGTKETKLTITLTNIGEHTWPLNCKLCLEKNQFINIDELYLTQQKSKESKNYEIIVKNLEKLMAGEYISFLCFYVNDKIIGNRIKMRIIIKKKNNNLNINIKKMIEKFRNKFSLSEKDFNDEKLEEKLKKNNYDFNQAFGSLFQ